MIKHILIILKKEENLKHLVDVASTEHSMNISEFLRLIRRKIRRENAILSAPPPQKLTRSTRWRSSLLPATFFHLSPPRVLMWIIYGDWISTVGLKLTRQLSRKLWKVSRWSVMDLWGFIEWEKEMN